MNTRKTRYLQILKIVRNEKERLPVVALRMCLTCGHVGCCDSSIGKHATKHFEKTGHPVMKTVPGDIWKWCYHHKETTRS